MKPARLGEDDLMELIKDFVASEDSGSARIRTVRADVREYAG